MINLLRQSLVLILLAGTLGLRIAAAGDFSVSAAPASQSVSQGQSATYLVTVTVDSSFSGQISLTATGLPAGLSASFSPSTVSASATATLTLTASAGASLGSSTINISAASGSETESTTVAATVIAPPPIQYTYDALGRLSSVTDQSGRAAIYAYDAVGNILSITRQDATQLSLVAFSPSHGLAGSSVTILGSGFNTTAGQNAVSLNGASATVTSVTATQMIATVPAGATSGPITVSNSNGSATSSSSFTVDTPSAPTPDFSLAVNPASLNVVAGESTAYLVNISGIAGFAGTVNLSVSSPSGVTASFNSNSVTAPGTAVLTVTTTSTTSSGTVSIGITGTSGALTHNITVPLVIASDASNFSLSLTPTSQTANVGSTVTYSLNVAFGASTQAVYR